MKNRISSFRDLFEYSDWADRKVFDLAEGLSDELLDRTFDLGPGSIRTTLIHIHEAAYWWFGMCREEDLPEPPQRESLADLKARWIETNATRDRMLASFTDESLDRTITWEMSPGKKRSARVIDILYHVANHSTHHRAQVSNMLRQLGITPPKLDYLVMQREKTGQ